MKQTGKGVSAELLRGSLVRFRRKCGGKNCRCQRGELHESWVLSYSEQRRTRLISLREEDVEGVEAALERYRRAREELEERAMKGLAKLEARLALQRQRR